MLYQVFSPPIGSVTYQAVISVMVVEHSGGISDDAVWELNFKFCVLVSCLREGCGKMFSSKRRSGEPF